MQNTSKETRRPARIAWLVGAALITLACCAIIAWARRAAGARVLGGVVMAFLGFAIVYVGLRRTQDASRTAATALALCVATVAAGWFYLIGI